MKVCWLLTGIWLIAFGAGLVSIFYSPCKVRSEYSMQISVETPDKIENAVSNAVSDLEERDFVPVDLDVKWHPASKTYVIHAWGIDRTRLGKYEP